MRVIDQYTPTATTHRWRWLSVLRVLLAVALFLVAAFQILRLVWISSYDMEQGVVINAEHYFTSPCFRHQRCSDLATIALLIFLGATLLARPKITVLFLRRFGLDVNFVVSRAVERKIGNRLRLVTLDDERFPSIGTTALERWFIRIVPPIAALGVTAVAVPIGAYFSNHPGSNFAQGDLGIEIQKEVGFYVAMFWAAFILVWVHTLATRRRSKLQVTTPQALARLMSEVDRSRFWRNRLSFMAPRALVAKVSDELWQESVRSLFRCVDIILIDVSEPTLNLHWEIEQARGLGLKCMFIAERNYLAGWSSPAESADSGEPRAQSLSLLASERVLAYDGSTRDGGAAFARSLKALLTEAAAKRASATKARKITRVVRFTRTALLWLGLAIVASYSGAVIGEGLVIWQMHRNFPMLVEDYYPQPYRSALLGNDFVVDSLLFVRYLDVCRGEELEKFHRYLEIQQEMENSKPH